MTRPTLLSLLIASSLHTHGQVLVDSIPYPGMLSLGFWGIHVTPDTIFLGADGPGHIYFSDHNGNILGNQPTGYSYNHGLIKLPGSYLIAKDFTTQGSILHEVDHAGQFIQQWNFPAGVLGNSGGVGDLAEAGGGAIWFTVYHPQSNTYPFTYAYKWIPGSPTLLDTVPLNGKQPYGITVKGDTLLYVIDNLHGDQERIYAYDLATGQDLFWFDLPDTPIDNDQRPFGLHWDGNFLYLVANRQGGSAFAYQTLFIYDMNTISTGTGKPVERRTMELHPNPATEGVRVHLPEDAVEGGITLELLDMKGRSLHSWSMAAAERWIPLGNVEPGAYLLRAVRQGAPLFTRKLTVVR